MRRIYVDYENVQSFGLNGIEMLSEEDEVLVFYSIHAETMRIDAVRKLMASDAQVTFVEAETGSSNALDFQLIAALFMNIKQDREYFIVSKDSGFDPAIDMGERAGYSIRRIISVDGLFEKKNSEKESAAQEEVCLSPQMQIENIISEKCGTVIAAKYCELIIIGLRKSEDKNQFYQFFQENLGRTLGAEIYRSIRSCFEEMKEILKT